MKTMSFSSNIAWSQGLSEWQLISIFSRHFLFEYVVLRCWRGDLTNCYTKKSSWEAPEFHTGYFLKGRIGEDNAKYKDWSATLFLYSVLVQLMVKSTLYKYSNSYDIYFRQVALFLKVGRGRLTQNLYPQKLSISRKKIHPPPDYTCLYFHEHFISLWR